MNSPRSRLASPYIEWAKLKSLAPVNLATSGVEPYPLSQLPLDVEDIAATSPGGYGYAPLLERLAGYLGVDPACVVAAPGASMANHLAMAASFEPGNEVLIERPVYEPMLSAALFLGAEVRRFDRREENGFRLDPAEIERQITPRTRLIVLTNMHNPTGAFASEDDVGRIGEIARGSGARVLVDEVYLEGLYGQRPPTSFRLGPEFITTSSLTKAFGLGGLRCGWLLAEPELTRQIWRLRDLHDVNSAHPAERISVVALDHLDRLAVRAEALLAANRPLVDRFLDTHPEMVTLRPRSGTVVTMRAPGGNGDAFCRHLRERYETSVVPGHFFQMPDCFRLGLGGETSALRMGLERLDNAVKEFSLPTS